MKQMIQLGALLWQFEHTLSFFSIGSPHAHFHLIPKSSEDDGLRYLRDEGTFTTIDQREIVDKLLNNW